MADEPEITPEEKERLRKHQEMLDADQRYREKQALTNEKIADEIVIATQVEQKQRNKLKSNTKPGVDAD